VYPPATSQYVQAAEAYLAHQRALGRGYAREERVLDGLIDFLIQSNYADLDHPGFESWCNLEGHLSANGRRSRQFVIRNFCLYRRRNEPDCFVPDPNYFLAPSLAVSRCWSSLSRSDGCLRSQMAWHRCQSPLCVQRYCDWQSSCYTHLGYGAVR